MIATNTNAPLFSAGQSDARSLASQILLLHRQRLTATELGHCRNAAAGHAAIGARSLESLGAIRDRAARRPEPRRTFGQFRRAA